MPAPAKESTSEYAAALTEAMAMLAEDPRTVFLGQGVAYPGTFMHQTLEGVPPEKRIEMPVAEEMQLGASIGLAMDGFIPVSLFPRWNFLLLAANQLVNHLDKLELISDYRAHVIVRVGVGSQKPLFPGHQHIGDFSLAFRYLLQTVQLVTLERAEDIVPTYRSALEHDGPSLIVEYADKYHDG